MVDGSAVDPNTQKLTLYREIFANSQDGIAIIGPDGVYLEQNAAHRALIGYSDQDLQGQTPAVHFGEETFARVAKELARTGTFRGELESRRKDGQRLVVEITAFRVTNGAGHPLCYVGIKRDVTQRRRAEEAQHQIEEALRRQKSILEAQYALTSILAGSPSLMSAAPRVLHATCEGLGWEVGTLWMVDKQAGLLRCVAVWQHEEGVESAFEVETRRRSFGPGEVLPGAVWSRGEPVWVPDVTQDPEFLRAPAAQMLGVRAAFAFPIQLRGETLGVVELFSRRVRQPEPDLVDVTRVIGTRLGQFIETKQGEEAVRHGEERLRMAMAAGRFGIWDWNPATGRVTWGLGLEEIHGLATGQFGGTSEALLELVHEADRETVRLAMERATKEDEDYEMEFRAVTPEGEVRWIDAKGRVLRDDSGQAVRVLGTATDTTPRKQAEEDLRFIAEASAVLGESLDYQQALASLARVVVPYFGDWCAIDIRAGDSDDLQRVATYHREPEKLQVAEEFQRRQAASGHTSRYITSVLQTGRSVLFRDIPDEVIDEAVPDPEDARLMRALGLRSAMVVPLSARGRTLGVLTVISAESRRRYTAKDLGLAEELGRRAGMAIDNALLYAQLQEASEAKDEFLGLVSHELRTPITAIYGGARMLRTRGDRLDEQVKAGIIIDIEQETERLYRLVEDLLALARVELGQKLAADEPVLVQRAIERVVTAYGQRRPGRPIDAAVEPDLPPVAMEGTYVEQIVRNLLSNADKYSPPESAVEIRAGSDGDEVSVAVLDRGQGFSEDDLGMVFERFYRSQRTARQAKGIGIGLTLCKRLVEAHGGRVWARNREGGGAEVGFALPAYKEGSE